MKSENDFYELSLWMTFVRLTSVIFERSLTKLRISLNEEKPTKARDYWEAADKVQKGTLAYRICLRLLGLDREKASPISGVCHSG